MRACLLLMHHSALFRCVWCIIYYTICWRTWQEHLMGLDFGTMNGFQGDFRGFYSNPLSFSGSTLPGPPINLNSTFTPGTFGSELIAPSSFGYDLASSSYPSDDMLPDFSFTNMLNGPWDFSGIDLNAIKLPVSEERSTSPRKRTAQAMLDPTKASELPLLPMPQGMSEKTAVSQPPPTQPTPSATAGPRPEPSFKLHGPQRHAIGSMPQKPIDPGKAPLPSTRNTGVQEAVPQTQTPPTELRMSKCVPVKSKRNEIANAIGTNNMALLGANKAAGQQTPGRSMAKRMGDRSSRGEKKYVKLFNGEYKYLHSYPGNKNQVARFMMSIPLSIQCHVFWVSWRMSLKYSWCVPYCNRLPAVSAGMLMLRVQKRWHNAHCTIVSVPPKGDGDGGREGDGVCTTLWHVIVSSHLEGRPGGRRGGGRVKGHDVLKVWQSAYRMWIQASKGWDVNHWWGWAGTRAMDSEMEGVRTMVCVEGRGEEEGSRVVMF